MISSNPKAISCLKQHSTTYTILLKEMKENLFWLDYYFILNQYPAEIMIDMELEPLIFSVRPDLSTFPKP